jgi:glycosyltransferase involved in cell wall biosynthesis
MLELHTWAPLLLLSGLLTVVLSYADKPTRFARAFAALICAAALLRYVYWRIAFAIPTDQNFPQQLFAYAFLFMEMATLTSNLLMFFFMARHVDRRAVADARQSSPLLDAPVDVLIPTYNEDATILERTIIGAKSIQHRDLRIWVLDDGARPWLRQLAEELGVLYLARVNGKHAKAGNINHGLQEVLKTGRPPEFVLLLDADFVPFCNILRRTLGLFEEVFTRWSFVGPTRLPLILRIGLLDSVLYWVSGAIFKLMVLFAPILFWFTGTAVIRASISDLLYWMAPAAAASILFTMALSEKLVLPVLADVTQFLTMFSESRTVVQAIVRPFGRKFKVTEKGISSLAYSVQWNVLWRFAGIAALTIFGMLIHTLSFSPYHGRPGYSLTVFWSLLNALLLFFASVICVEPPKRRLDERFSTNDPASVLVEDGSELPCRFHDLSLGGACLVREEGWRSLVGPAWLVIDRGRIKVPFDVVRRTGEKLALKFRSTASLRRQLIVHLFTGAYHQDVESVSVPKVVRALCQVIIS